MTNEDKSLLRKKWEYTNELKKFRNVMGKMEGFGWLDLRTDGVIVLRDNLGELKYSLVGRIMEIAWPAKSNNTLGLEIDDVTAEQLTLIVRVGRHEDPDKFGEEVVKLTYRAIN